MNSGLAIAVIVGSLLLAAWSLLTSARNRPPDLTHIVGAVVVELLVLTEAVAAIARIIDGARPAEPATFWGYLIASVLLLPAGVALALLERSRYGVVILGVAALVLPVLILRLQQVWSG